MTRTRASVRSVVGLAIASLAFAACSGGATPAPSQGAAATTPPAGSIAPAASAAEGPVTLTWWDYFGYSPASNGAVQDMIKGYETAHPNVTIQRTAIGFADFRTKLIQAAASGTFPDIAAIDNSDIPVFASQSAIADLSQYESSWSTLSNFLPAVAKSVQFQGKFYGAPFRSNTTALFYDTDAFAAAGISAAPATWDQLRADAKALTTATRSGICFSAAPTEEGTYYFLPFLWQAGGDVGTIGDQPSVDALTFVNDLVNVDKSAPKSMIQWGQSDVATQFAAGRCAMMLNGPYTLGTAKTAKFKWAVAPWPAGSAGTAAPLGGEVWAVGANSKNVAAVWSLIDWLSQPANTLKDIASGLSSIPNRTDVASDPAWNWDPTVPVFAQQMKTARPRGVYGANYAQVSQAIWTMEQQVLAGQKSAQAAATAAGATIKPLLPAQ